MGWNCKLPNLLSLYFSRFPGAHLSADYLSQLQETGKQRQEPSMPSELALDHVSGLDFDRRHALDGGHMGESALKVIGLKTHGCTI